MKSITKWGTIMALSFLLGFQFSYSQSSKANQWVESYNNHAKEVKLSSAQQQEFDDIIEFGKLHNSEKAPEEINTKIAQLLTDDQRKKWLEAVKKESTE